MKHSVPISATFPLFTYFNITPSISLTDRMYTQKVRRAWDPAASAEVADTTYSFYNVWDFNAAISLDTKVYGFYQPLPFLGDKVKMIRHVFTPTISFSGAPDFSSPFFGYYGSYDYTDAQGNRQTKKYSMFPSSLYGVPGLLHHMAGRFDGLLPRLVGAVIIIAIVHNARSFLCFSISLIVVKDTQKICPLREETSDVF